MVGRAQHVSGLKVSKLGLGPTYTGGVVKKGPVEFVITDVTGLRVAML